ncbi:patatin-like phospholipase family protein [Undibacterium sp. RTI2.1]|uniref:patatin-like phospholipase family protein n=1 Tax=unclassified Undibacterium TaxID=2630295 RepID=UPI002AB3BFA7|nr:MULTISPECIES: patatin-like phospholipase family protein [unclassified Undibacterium]MDY7537428.1 patatin-like phospholipase family protein [Undibacterium sp. 5I1]MEB0032284.1 patatin-like phospholipase family protein [Undibacterium sp. RTI2.1]MEB0118420.1 patatin-like phospholipase family protein [Undibacterium sp. RTI2.2]MEB0232088.1 patatin-like phospholipase family protein [Undibacterium sp. 10I3]MEB0259377.1 patatin-like phospholipase family protein [Undibacterium sp. 5I1]
MPTAKKLCLAVVCLISLTSLFSQSALAERLTTTKPLTKTAKICVALSGGGARGFAHVGVLKALEELNVPIDCIAGTSMGAVVGGLYAAGLSATEIEQRLQALKLDDIALDRVQRRMLPEALREEDTQYPLGATLGLSASGVRLPSGAVQATQFLELLQNWTVHIQPDINFDKLPIPFRAVATDLESGKMVVFDKGPLYTAIRASMAAPGVFAPVEVNGRLLTDGGLVRNLPVDIARSMGADIVIAVNIGTPLLPRDKLQSLFNVSQQMINILTEQNVEMQKAGLKDSDILIEPDLGSISFMDFGRSAEASVIGQNAAQAIQEKLLSLSLEPHLYAAKQQTRLRPPLPSIDIAFVDVVTDGAIPEMDIRRQVSIKIGSKYNAEEINRKLAVLNITREFDSINHQLIQRNGEYGVQINANGRNWGPHFLRFGLALSGGFEGAGGFRLQVGHRRPWLTDSGLEWRNDAEFGSLIRIRSELRQPIFEREGSYLSPYIELGQNARNLYNDDVRIAEYNLQKVQLGLDVGIPLGELGTLGEVRFGIAGTRYRVRPKLGGVLVQNSDGSLGSQPLPSANLQQAGFKSSFVIDQLSDSAFPRDGYKLASSLFVGVDKSRSNYQEFTFDSIWAQSIDNQSINLKLSGAGLFQNDTEIRGIGTTLGGFQQLSAYQPDQFAGNYLLYGSVTYLLRAVKFEMAGQNLFLGTSFEAGNVWNSRSEISFPSLRKSASVFVGFNSFMGPIYLGVAVAPAGTRNIFFQLGRQ